MSAWDVMVARDIVRSSFGEAVERVFALLTLRGKQTLDQLTTQLAPALYALSQPQAQLTRQRQHHQEPHQQSQPLQQSQQSQQQQRHQPQPQPQQQLPFNQKIKDALLVLMQHNIVTYIPVHSSSATTGLPLTTPLPPSTHASSSTMKIFTPSPTSIAEDRRAVCIFYQADLDAVLARLWFPSHAVSARMLFGLEAEYMVTELLKHGRLTFDEIIEFTLGSLGKPMTPDTHAAAVASLLPILETIWTQGFLCVCNPEDQVTQATRMVTAGERLMLKRQQSALKTSKNGKNKEVSPEPDEVALTRKDDNDMELDTSIVAPGNKRKIALVDETAANGCGPSKKRTTCQRIDGGNLFRVNMNRFYAYFREREFVGAVVEKFDTLAGLIMQSIMQIPAVRDSITPSTDCQSASQKSLSSVSFSAVDIEQALSEVARAHLLEAQQVLREDGVFQAEPTRTLPAADLPDLHHLATANQSLAGLIETYLRLFSADAWNFITRSTETSQEAPAVTPIPPPTARVRSLRKAAPSAPALVSEKVAVPSSEDTTHYKYVLNAGHLADAIREMFVMGFISDQWGEMTLRVWRCVKDAEMIVEQQIQEVCLLDEKTTREKLYTLLRHGFLKLHEQKGTGTMAGKPLFIWSFPRSSYNFSRQQLHVRICSMLYHTVFNLRKRATHEHNQATRAVEESAAESLAAVSLSRNGSEQHLQQQQQKRSRPDAGNEDMDVRDPMALHDKKMEAVRLLRSVSLPGVYRSLFLMKWL